MYSVQAYDVVNGLVKDFRYSMEQGEHRLACELTAGLEQKSLAIYDRLHLSYPLIASHIKAKNYFLIRARCGGDGGNVQRNVRDFRNEKKSGKWVTWKPQGKLWTQPSLRVRLVKIRHPETKEIMIYATNLTEDKFSDAEIAELYLRRWDVEGSFRDLTATLKMEQWHSKKLNGILQEIYALLWLVNQIKFACFSVPKRVQKWLMKARYRKCNFKLCVSVFIDHLDMLIDGKSASFMKILSYWIRKTTEERERMSRRYPRVVRKRGIAYDRANIVPRRA
jgi:hypothetical protein